MAALCLDASLETLRPLCYSSTLRLQGDNCRCLYKGSPQALQAFVTVSARRILQKSPQCIVQGFEVCTPRSNKINNYNSNNNNKKLYWNYETQKQSFPLHKVGSDLAKTRQWREGRRVGVGRLVWHFILHDSSKSVTNGGKKEQYYDGWLRRVEIQKNVFFHELRNSTVFLVILAVNIIYFPKQN